MNLAQIMANTVEVGDCIEWQGRMGCGGSSTTPIYKSWNGRYSTSIPVCREVWQFTRGPIPAGKIVYRLCCNNRCIGCLALGVRGDAMRQRKKIGLAKHRPSTRAAITRGSRIRKTAKYGLDQARVVRAAVATGKTRKEAAIRAGVSYDAACQMAAGNTWAETSHASSVFTWRPNEG
jgi:hypothetical protein